MEGEHLAIDQAASVLGEAATLGEPIAISDLANAGDALLRDVAIAAGFHSVLVVPLVDQGHSGIAGGAAAQRRRILAEPDRADAHLRASIGTGDAQPGCSRKGPEGPRTGERPFHRAGTGRQASGADRAIDELERSLEERVEKQLAEIERSAGSSVFWRRKWRN